MIIEKLVSLFTPTFDWIQVEVTSACNAACIYCPRTVYRKTWEDRHLPLETFKKLKPAFADTRHIHLQGWGEPFLHPDFFEMVAIAKAQAFQVGTTTNAMLLNEETVRKVIESGLDILAFSLAGTTERNDVIRKGTSLKNVLKTIETLSREKEKRGTSGPEIHVAYMLFRSGMTELETLPSLLEGLGVSQVVVSTLDFVPTEELRKEAVIPATEEEYREICTENIQRALCVSSDGAVTPCVYTSLGVSGTYYDLQGEKVSYQRMVFGNIQEKDVRDIWKEKFYSAFRRSFCKGELAPTCQKCPKIW